MTPHPGRRSPRRKHPLADSRGAGRRTETVLSTVDRLLAAPGHRPATRGARLTIADGRIAAIDATDDVRSNGRIALPAMVNAHDHGYGVRPLALGGSDDALECWIASLSRVTVEPRLEAAVAFGRMALAGIGATVHCHNSLVADRLEYEAAGVALAAADVGNPRRVLLPDPGPESLGLRRPARPAPASARGRPGGDRDHPRHDGAAGAFHLVDQVEAIAAAHESELFQVQYGPIGPQWCQDATLERIAEASAVNDRRVHMHLLESRRQREWLDATYRQGIVRFLDDIGLLSLAAHRGARRAPHRRGVRPDGRTRRHRGRQHLLQSAHALRRGAGRALRAPRPALRLRPRRLRARRRPGLLPRPAPRLASAQRHRPGTGPAAGPAVRRRLPPRLPVHRWQRRLR